MTPHAEIRQTLENARASLLAERTPGSGWEGELSSSALSTATAVLALMEAAPAASREMIEAGSEWLCSAQNADGGWGDTTRSFSNISTTLLARAALTRAAAEGDGNPMAERARAAIQRTGNYLMAAAGGDGPDELTRAVIARYGKDRTFSVPILMACAIGGVLGNERDAWRRVLPLPFELAALPRRTFAALRLPVVSYALPALIAIGFARYRHAPPRSLAVQKIRAAAWPRASELLRRIQPESGGFLEATPLTSFVVMALASADQRDHPTVTAGLRFLRDSARADGSWPIDTNLATWVTTLAVKALGSDLPAEAGVDARRFLLRQQHLVRHPYTDTPPGGWAWTSLSGGVPDADDTAGAMLALREIDPAAAAAAARAARWLLDLQNRDGGMPTFCRGWGALPFDRSAPDLTAHAVRAWKTWLPDMPGRLADELRWAIRRGIDFLAGAMAPDGSWLPLWFGCQHANDDSNPVYGTAAAVTALTELTERDHADVPTLRRAGVAFLLAAQNEDGGWGGAPGAPSTIEETSLAAEALCRARRDAVHAARDQLERAAAFLAAATKRGTGFPAAPIGFYFAKLWYFEKLYPLVWSVGALRHLSDALAAPDDLP